MPPIRIGRLKLAVLAAAASIIGAMALAGVDGRLTLLAAVAGTSLLGLTFLIVDSHRAVRSELRRLRTEVRAARRERPADPRPQLAEVARWDEAIRSGHPGAVGIVETLATDQGLEPTARARAWVALARQRGAEGDAAGAYEAITFARVADPVFAGPSRERAALEADFLVALGRREDAQRVVAGIDGFDDDPDLLLRMSATEADDDGRLAWVNQVYQRAGFAPLARLETTRPLTIDNLTTVTGTERQGGPLVSVIVTAYESASMLSTALRSLQRQTWTNLQVIVVDDGSSDDTADVAERFAGADQRIQVLRLASNRGAYPARNAGLALADGDLITTHDADDWSHAQKIETQVTRLLAEPDLTGCMSSTTRVKETLLPAAFSRPKKQLISSNFSSIMLRREVFDRVGEWDAVRSSGDAEMLYRVLSVYGEGSVVNVATEVPLMLARLVGSSLTSSPETGIMTLFRDGGARRCYREAFRTWHASESFAVSLPWRPSDGGPRPFDAPAQLLADRQHTFEA